jgi:hypothetical protein
MKFKYIRDQGFSWGFLHKNLKKKLKKKMYLMTMTTYDDLSTKVPETLQELQTFINQQQYTIHISLDRLTNSTNPISYHTPTPFILFRRNLFGDPQYAHLSFSEKSSIAKRQWDNLPNSGGIRRFFEMISKACSRIY